MPSNLIALFPLITMGDISCGTQRLAGPKALAAQTFKAREAEVPFLESGYWAEFSGLFAKQVSLLSPPPAVDIEEAGPWVAYPFAVHPDYDDRTCAAWVDTTPKRPYVRHVRLYRRAEAASADNLAIDAVMGRSSGA